MGVIYKYMYVYLYMYNIHYIYTGYNIYIYMYDICVYNTMDEHNVYSVTSEPSYHLRAVGDALRHSRTHQCY